MTFAQIDRPVVICGLTCADRLAALQLMFEHKITHLIGEHQSRIRRQ